jgi:UDP-N-acetylmuramoylalanine--D-glutamate ligase
MDYRGQRATIMGLGHFGGGAAAARWLARRGAVVTVSDMADEAALADSLPLLADVPIAAIHVGGHREEDFRQAALIVVNPAVRPSSPGLEIARRSGARLCTELELFIENCPARMIGVTGSNGKSTTAAMIAAILRAAGRRAFLGGNIGGSLLEELPRMTPDDWVVLEISSFQLWHFGPAVKMPHVAVITGCSPNHLDWHVDFRDYAAAKQRILTGQTPDDFAVLNTLDAEVASWRPLVRGGAISFDGANISVCRLTGKNACPTESLIALPPLPVPGEHNRRNAACAAAAAATVGCSREAVCRGLETFRGLPQRLEHIANIDGRQFYNDSTATTPESTIAALRSLAAPMWLLAGGKNKGFEFGSLATEIVGRARGAAFFGAVRHDLRERVAALDAQFPCAAVETLRESLDWCWQQSRPGDAIVLSPACASTDQFRNFRERGARFEEAVHRLAQTAAH